MAFSMWAGLSEIGAQAKWKGVAGCGESLRERALVSHKRFME